jgi:hypothetical protein
MTQTMLYGVRFLPLLAVSQLAMAHKKWWMWFSSGGAMMTAISSMHWLIL